MFARAGGGDSSLRAGVRRVLNGQQQIIVDGYNVIYADDALRKVALGDMERARRDFVSRIEAYVADKSLRVTVVFDGKGGLTDAETIVPGKLQVIFTPRHETADDVIVSMVKNSENPRSHLVVSSDRMHIRPAVSELGCRAIGAKAFLERISEKAASTTREEEKKPQPAADDIDFWLRRFEDGEEDES
jgi:predicted RNA-binding protein with PIN domain